MSDDSPIPVNRRAVLRTGALAGALATTGLGAAGSAAATPPPGTHCQLDRDGQLSYDGDGERVLNVTRRVVNGLDTGRCEPWANDDFLQHIQAWDEGDRFVAVFTWNGRFEAFEGAGTPGDPDCETTLDGDESGPFEGGVRLTFTGTFDPERRTEGHLGTVDQGCERTKASCDFRSSVDWLDDYFDGWGDLSLEWWGAVYHGGRDGTWVNAIDGDCGNIV